MRYSGEIVPIRSKFERIPSAMRDPHYTDERFTRSTGGLTIFLAEGVVTTDIPAGETVEGAHYNYSDRIWHGYDHKFVQQAYDEAFLVTGNKDTAAYYEAMLQRVYEDPTTELQHIIAGVNNSNGYSYQIYGTVSGSATN